MKVGMPIWAMFLFFSMVHILPCSYAAKSTPLPVISPPIKRESRSLAPIPFKGSFSGTTRTSNMMYSAFSGKFRGVQLHKYIEAHFDMKGHGRINMLGFVGKFTSSFEGKYTRIMNWQKIEGINRAEFDGMFSGQRMKITMKAKQKTTIKKSGYMEAYEKGTFSSPDGNIDDGTYSIWIGGDKVEIKIKTKPKKIKGKKRKKAADIYMRLKLPQLATMLNGEMDGYWTMYHGGKMMSGSLKQMMP